MLKIKDYMKEKIKSYVRGFLKKRNYNSAHFIYMNFYKAIIEANPCFAKYVEGEEKWLAHWRKYDKNLQPLCYRIFSHFIGKEKKIIPLELVSSIIEPILTPAKYREYYSDKNNFLRILPPSFLPEYFLMDIDGLVYDSNYDIVEKENIDKIISKLANRFDRIVIKPSRSSSGNGVQIIKKNDAGLFVAKNNIPFSYDFIKQNYKTNWCLQECINQSDYMAHFNPTSINTIRIAVYRDETGNWMCLSAALRIGAVGSEVDNAHAGGKFCGILPNGKIGNYVCDVLGKKEGIFNELDFENNNWKIPNYDMVKQFAIDVAKKIIHHDLIAMDIALDKNDKPVLWEFIVGGFGSWIFPMTGSEVFAGIEDEVMDRCYRQYQKLEYYIWTPIHRKDDCVSRI